MPKTDIVTYLDTINKDLQDMIKNLTRVRSSSGAKRMAKEFADISLSISKMAGEISKSEIDKAFKKAINKIKQEDDKFTKNAINNSNKRYQTESKNLKKTRREEDLAFKRRIDQLSSYSTRLKEFFKMQLAWYPAKAFTFKVLAIPNDVLQSTANYSDALAQVSSVAQLLPSELEKVDKVIKETSASTKYSLTEIAQASKILAQAGFKGEELIKAIKPISLLSTATASTIQEATDLVSTVVKAYDKTASQISEISDTLAAAVTSSKLTIKDLGEAFSYVASASSQAGISFETTTAILGILANRGMKMSTAATGLRMALLKMIAPTKQAVKELEKLNLPADALDPTKHSIQEIIDLLASIDPDSLIKIFSARSASAIMSLTQAGSTAITKMQETMDQQGIAASMAAEQLLNLKQSWKNLLDVIGQFYTLIGQTFSDQLAVKIRTFKNIILEAAQGVGFLGTSVKLLVDNLGKLFLTMIALSGPKLLGTGGIFATTNAVKLASKIKNLTKVSTAWGMKLASIKILISKISLSKGFIEKFKTLIKFTNIWYLALAAIIGALGIIIYKSFESKRKLEELNTSATKARVNFAKFKADVSKSSLELPLKIKISKEDSILGKEYLKQAKEDAINKLQDMISSLKEIAEDEKADVLSILVDNLNNSKDLNLTRINNILKTGFDAIGDNIKERFLRIKLLMLVESGKLSEAVANGIKDILNRKGSLSEAFSEYSKDSKNLAAKAEQINYSSGWGGILGISVTNTKGFASADKIIQELKAKGEEIKELIPLITNEVDKGLTTQEKEIREKIAKAFLITEEELKKHKNKSYTKEYYNSVIKPLEDAIKNGARELGEDNEVIKDYSSKLEKILSGKYLKINEAEFVEKFNNLKKVFEDNTKDLSKKIFDVDSLTNSIKQLTPGSVKAAKELVEKINSEISRITKKGGANDPGIKVLLRLKNNIKELYSESQVSLITKYYDKQIKNHQANISVAKSLQELAKEQGDYNKIAIYSIEIHNEQIKILQAKYKKKLAEAKLDKKITADEEKHLKIIKNGIKLQKTQIELEKIYASYKSSKKQLEYLEKIAKAQGRVTDATKLRMQSIEANIDVLEKELNLVDTASSRYQELSAEILLLKEEYKKLQETLASSSLYSGFVKRLKEINNEYKNIGITAKDGIDLVDNLNKVFVNTIENGFSSILDGTKNIGNVFKDTLNQMFIYFKDWVAKILATKIVIPIIASFTGGLVSSIASGFTGSAASAIAGTAGSSLLSGGFSLSALGTGLSAWGSHIMGGITSIQNTIANWLPGASPNIGTIPTQGLGATGISNWVSGLSPAAFSGLASGITAAVLTGLRTGDWLQATGSGAATGLGTWGGMALGNLVLPGLGGVIGGAIGGLLGNLGFGSIFGHKKKKPKEYYHALASLGFDESGTFRAFGGYTPREAGDTYIGTYLTAHGKHTKHELDQALLQVSKEFDNKIGEVLDGWANWINDFSSKLPENTRNNLIKTLDEIDFSWQYDNKVTKPDEEKLQKTIEDMLKNLNESLWDSFGPALIPALDESFKQSFEKLGVIINENLLGDNLSIEEFQTASEKVAFRLSTITELHDTYIQPINKLELAINSLKQNFNDLASKMREAAATTAELSEIDRIQDIAIQKLKDDFAKQISNIFTEIDKYLHPESFNKLTIAIEEVNNQFDQWKNNIIELGGTSEQLEQLAEDRLLSIQKLKDDFAKQISNIFTEIDKYLHPESFNKLTTAIEEVNNQFDQWKNNILELGGTSEQLDQLAEDRLLAIQKVYDDFAKQISDFMDSIYNSVEYDKLDSINKGLKDLENKWDDIIKKAKELNVSQAQLAELYNLSAQAIDDYNKQVAKNAKEFMRNTLFNNNYSNLSEYEYGLAQLSAKWKDLLKTADELHVSESDRIVLLQAEIDAINNYKIAFHEKEIKEARSTLIESYNKEISDLQNQLSSLTSNYSQTINIQQSKLNDWSNILNYINSTINNLKNLGSSVNQIANNARREFNKIFNLTISGDKKAASQLSAVTSTYTASLLKTSKTSFEYRKEIANIRNKLLLAEKGTNTQVSIAESTLNSLNNQLDTQKLAIQSQIEYDQDQINKLTDIDHHILTVAEALANYTKLLNEEIELSSSTQNTSDIPKLAAGGVTTGPTSGYSAILHGTEAVIPLNNTNIPLIIDFSEIKKEIISLKKEIKEISLQQLTYQQKSSKILRKWDTEGQPETRN